MEKEYSVVLPMADYIREFRDAGRFIEYCKACGQYGTCWACPPFDFDTDKVLGRYDSILLVAVKTDVSSGPGKTADPESLPDKCGIADCADSVRTGMPVSGKSGGVDTGVDVCPDNEMRMRLLDRVRVVMDKRLLEKEASCMEWPFSQGHACFAEIRAIRTMRSPDKRFCPAVRKHAGGTAVHAGADSRAGIPERCGLLWRLSGLTL